ncbi:MAG: LamG domain-containing protein, partial [Nanoarchaeota archaeon]
ITSLILIVVVFVAVGIVWVVVKNVLKENSEKVEINKLSVSFQIEKVLVGAGTVDITVKRNVGAGDFWGLKFILENQTGSVSYDVETTINELEFKTFNFSYFGNLTKISVAPIFKTASGKTQYSNIVKEFNVGTGVSTTSGGGSSSGSCDSDSDSYNSSNMTCMGNDCNDSNPSVFTNSTGFFDGDGDTWTIGSGQVLCTNGTLPVNYTSTNKTEDCNDNNINLNQTISCIYNGALCGTYNLCVASCPSPPSENCTNGVDDDCDNLIDGADKINCPVQYLKIWNGLVSWWRFEGNAKDELGKNNGTVNGGATMNLTGGIYGTGAYQFDGVNDVINVSHSQSINLSGSMTISLWFNANKLNNFMGFAGKTYNDGNNYIGYGFYYRTNTQTIRFFVNKDIILSSSPIFTATNSWHHLVGTFNGTNAVLYLDNVASAPSATTSLTTNNQSLYIGNYGSPGGFFNGSIDEIMIFNRSLNSSEVQEIYNLNLS